MLSIDVEKQSAFRWFVLLIILVVQFHLMAVLFAPAALASAILTDLHITKTEFGLIMSAVNVTVMLCVVLGSILVDRAGLKKGLLYGLAALGIGATAVLLVHSLPLFLAARIIQGVGIAIAYPVLGAMIMAWFSTREQPYINTIFASGAFLGTGAAFIVTAELFRRLQGSWKAALSCYGASALVIAAVWLLGGRDRTRSAPQAPPVEPDARSERRQSSLSTAVHMPVAWQLTIAIFAVSWVYNMYFSFLPLFLQNNKGFPLAAANRLASFLPFSGVAGVIVCGLLSKRASLRKHLLWTSCAIVIVGSIALFFGDGAIMKWGLLIAGFGVSGFLPVLSTYMMSLPAMTPSLVAAFLVMINVATYMAGFISPLLVGWLSQTPFGLRNTMALFSWMEVLAIVMFLRLPAIA